MFLHRLEPGGYKCVGDYENDDHSSCLCHIVPPPLIILLLICSILAKKANRAAQNYADNYGFNRNDDDDNDNNSFMDFEGERLFRDGANYFGDVNTCVQRVCRCGKAHSAMILFR
jgi:hypothetical protein